MTTSRVAGALYLPVFVIGPLSLLYVRGQVYVEGDATATAARLAGHAGLVRAGAVGEVYLALTDVVLAALFYVLFRPGGKPVALAMGFLRLTWGVVAAVGVLGNLTALRLAGNPKAALALLDLHTDVFAVGFVAFGLHLGLLGYVGWRSRLLPRVIAVLLVVAAAGYVANSLLTLGSGTSLFALMLPAFPAELSLCLWLLIKKETR